jgi:hypothetical protein
MTDEQQNVIDLDADPRALPAVVEVNESASPILAAVKVMAVKDDDDERAATELLVQIKSQLTAAERARVRLVKPIKDHAKMIDEEFKATKGPLEEAEGVLKDRILAYRRQVERERQEEIQRQLAEQREREEQEQRDREAAAEAERVRLAAEHAELKAIMAALGDDELQQIARGGREDERGVAQAILSERIAAKVGDKQAQLDVDGAEAIAPEDVTDAGLEHIAQAEAAAPPPPVPAPLDLPAARPSVTRTESGSAHTRKRWKFEVTDAMQVPRQYLMVDDRLLRAAVSDGEREIPGVRIYAEDDLAVRAR